jgi:hypothetical protein
VKPHQHQRAIKSWFHLTNYTQKAGERERTTQQYTTTTTTTMKEFRDHRFGKRERKRDEHFEADSLQIEKSESLAGLIA